MDNKTAFWMALIIVCIFAADILYFEWDLMVILGKLTASASNWLAFWRRI